MSWDDRGFFITVTQGSQLMEAPSWHVLPPPPREGKGDMVTCALPLEVFCLEVTHALMLIFHWPKPVTQLGPTSNEQGKVQFSGFRKERIRHQWAALITTIPTIWIFFSFLSWYLSFQFLNLPPSFLMCTDLCQLMMGLCSNKPKLKS